MIGYSFLSAMGFFIYLLFFYAIPVHAESNTNCSNRYLTLVNPVRGRSLWKDQTLNPLKDQYQLIKNHNFSATWLLQYDAVGDHELTNEIKRFNSKQEVGVFLEVSEKFAGDARVIYPYDVAWSDPQAVFLSGYSQSERRRLIDKLFSGFKKEFGYYPKSVGAWWIDSYSLDYTKKKYGIEASLIVADQRTTDKYGVWGQWWGYPYYPSKANILVPTDNLQNKQDIIIIQWALRDLLRSYGSGPQFSNYSLQANDYTSLGKDTTYFEDLTKIYLDCRNPLGQITVGLETGIEGVDYLDEYKNQLTVLQKIENLQSVTMSGFSEKFAQVYPKFPGHVILGKNGSEWILTTNNRANKKLGDFIDYQADTSFKDYFVSDDNKVLNRRLNEVVQQKSSPFQVLLIPITLLIGILSYYKKIFKVFIISLLFTAAAYGLVLRSYYQYGWQVFFGPEVNHLILTQILLAFLSFLVMLTISRNLRKFNLWLIPLLFGIDPLIQILRFSYISEKYYFGFSWDSLRFIGISFKKPFEIGYLNQDFPAYQAAALLKIGYSRIWDSIWLWLFIYPIIHMILAFILGYFIEKLSTKLGNIITGILAILLIWHLTNILQADPRIATPNLY